MRLGLIIPHKTKVAIALWRRYTKEFEALVRDASGLFCLQMLNFARYNKKVIF